MKKGPAIIASLVTGLFLVFGVMAVGLNALVAARLANPAVSTPAAASADAAALEAHAQQLEARIAEYQAREADLQAQVLQLNQQLDETSRSLSEYQRLVSALQERGVIRIDSSGQVHVNQSEGDDD
ncbi:MAG TPA: hypothetical protein PKW33_07185 [Anaerolineaceae bacterium]|nr:hypothetical protein [Anaerolineaceae bacterium]HPN51354.1 hypothetical protein [Anaerolineaceae bacterium]